MLETKKFRRFFSAIRSGRTVSNNAASTQIPSQLLDMMRELAVDYDNVHRGQSDASRLTTERFEQSYDTIALFIGAESRRNIALYRNATEAVNSVMYSLLTEFRDGDNLVTTLMEHNSNYVPWYGLVNEILSRFGVKVECRLARFDRESGELDMEHLRSLIDSRTKLVCCTGASNFLGTKNPIRQVRALADGSGYIQPDGEKKSYLLVDGCQLVPNAYVNVQELGVDFLVWSFHKMLAPFGVGGLYARESLLARMKPFLYGGDMIAEGQVTAEKVLYNSLPWKYAAGTPNILGTILSAQAIRLLMDFSLNPGRFRYFRADRPLEAGEVAKAMKNVEEHERALIGEALDILRTVPGISLYGPQDPAKRTCLASFNIKDKSPMEVAESLNRLGVESRAGCHCATLAHHDYGLTPPASCRLSFYVYNDLADVRKACMAVRKCA